MIRASDIAEWNGWSRQKAWRWMRDMHVLHPDKVTRDDRGYAISKETYDTLAKPDWEALARRLVDLEDRMDAVEIAQRTISRK